MLRGRFAQVLVPSFVALSFSWIGAAHAVPVLQSADISLHSSTLTSLLYSSDTLSDTGVSAGPGEEICIPGDSGCPTSHAATNIAGDGSGAAPPASGSTPMLPGEYIDLVPTPASIVVSIANGDPGSLHSGYAPGSYYLFSNLVFDTPETIVGVILSLNNISNLTVSDIGVTANSVMLPIDQLNIGSVAGSGGTGTVTMSFEFQSSSGGGGGGTVPEPNVLALVAASILAATFASRVRSRQ